MRKTIQKTYKNIKNSYNGCISEKKIVPLHAKFGLKREISPRQNQKYNIMIYQIKFSCDEVDDFRRVYEADSDATFLELHNAILKSVGFPDDQMTSFYMCNDRWEKGQEVTLVEMGSNFEYDNMIMESTRLSDLLEENGQRMIYVFDPMNERYFFGRVADILPGMRIGVECVEKKGDAPLQVLQDVIVDPSKSKGNEWDIDDDFYGDSQYDDGDLDLEGFQDLSFDDGSMF